MPPPQSPDPKHVFTTLDAALPLALLPVRIETRFMLRRKPRELLVRIFPDAVHADGHVPELTKLEQELGRAYWRRVWRLRDTAAHDAAFAWLADQLGPWRAAWVARRLRPLNLPAGTVPGDRPGPKGGPGPGAELPDLSPEFPGVETLAEGRPTWARLLPERFSATLVGPTLSEIGIIGTWWGGPIPDDLPLAPGPVDTGGNLDGREWLDAQGLGWTVDFAAAEQVGLGIRIDLSGFSAERIEQGFAYLVVCGVRAHDQAAALEALVEAHRYTNGLDFIPQGTPTNTTETSGRGMSLEAPDLAALRDAEVGAARARTRPAISADGDLYRRTAADGASIALGFGRGNALDRTEHAALADLPNAEAMNRALWPGLLGHYLDSVFDGIVSDAGRAWLREWGTAFARGGAPLPTLLVGAQPYGLLPVTLVTRPGRGSRTEVEEVEDVLRQLWVRWVADAETVARLDPDAPDVAGDGTETAGELAARASAVMASVPHPTAFRLQRVDAMRSPYWQEWSRRLLVLGIACGSAPPGEPPYSPFTASPIWSSYEQLQRALDEADSVIDQKLAIDDFIDDLGGIAGALSDAQKAHHATWAQYAREWLLDFAAAHQLRGLQLAGLLEGLDVSGMMGDLSDPNALFNVHPTDATATWELPLVAEEGGEQEVADLRAWLDDLVATLDHRAGTAQSFSTPQPLLRALLHWSIERATDPADAELLRRGLPALAGIARTAADPVGELERLMRETLGVHQYRLDAWFTAVAAWRLENKRQTTPTGLHAGAYGLLCDVRPRETLDASQGYVLAPSLTHATTAAVLRSGWAALGGQGQGAGMAVDLSSDRVRRARWITDGVREGQDLGRLIGGRFERGLHDAALDRWIDDFRRLALDARGEAGPTTAIVDGLLLARARLGAEDLDEEKAAATAIEALLDGAGDDRAGLEDVLDSLAADLDAVADAAIAQSVFSLVQGDVPEATATLTAAASGDVTFPELRVADTPRPALTVTHRLLALLPQESLPQGASGRAVASPALAAWVTALLGPLDAYRFTYRFGAGPPVEASLADLGLSALDLVYLSPLGDESGLGPLGALLAARVEGLRPADAPPATLATDHGDPSVDDLALACRALRRLIGEARDLDAADLASPGAADIPLGINLDKLTARADAVRESLREGKDRLATALAGGDVRTAMLSLAGFRLAGGVPGAGDALTATGEALLAEVDARLIAHEALVAEQKRAAGSADERGQLGALRARIDLLLGEALPLAPLVAPANAPELDATFGRPRLGSREQATDWLAAAGRVDPGARRLRVAVDLAEAVRDEVLFDFSLGQLPDHSEDGWAAVARPAHDDRGRVCLLATGERPRFADGVRGLVLATWTEAVPHTHQTAGLAVHFDAPSARAPQAILLCSAEPGRGFDFELVRDVVVQTFELARARMAGPETLLEVGQYLPASYLDSATAAQAT